MGSDSAPSKRGHQLANAMSWPASIAVKVTAWWLSLLGALLISITSQFWARFWPATILGVPIHGGRVQTALQCSVQVRNCFKSASEVITHPLSWWGLLRRPWQQLTLAFQDLIQSQWLGRLARDWWLGNTRTNSVIMQLLLVLPCAALEWCLQMGFAIKMYMEGFFDAATSEKAAATSNAPTTAGLSGSAASASKSSSASSTASTTHHAVKLSLTIIENVQVSLAVDSAEQHAQEKHSFQAQVSDLQNQLANTKGKLAASDKACAATQQELDGVNSKLAMSNKACKLTEEKLAVSEAAVKQKDRMIVDLRTQLKAAAVTPSKVTNPDSVKSGSVITSPATSPMTPATSPETRNAAVALSRIKEAPAQTEIMPAKQQTLPSQQPRVMSELSKEPSLADEPAAPSLLAPGQAMRAPASVARPLLQPTTALKLAEGKPHSSKPSNAKDVVDIAASAGCEIQATDRMTLPQSAAAFKPDLLAVASAADNEHDWDVFRLGADPEVYRRKRTGSMLGSSANGKVFRAEKVGDASGPLATPLPVAVKEIQLKPGYVTQDSVEHEAEILRAQRSLTCGVPFHGMHVDQANSTAYLVMGVVKGRTVSEVCRSIHSHARQLQPGHELNALKAWTWQFALQLTDYISKVLYMMHLHGIYHRDVKPLNFIITELHPKVKGTLVDWGSGRHSSQDEILNTGYTNQYASPQIALHFGTTCPTIRDDMTDMWALGVLAHSVFTCANPAWHPAFDPVGGDGQGLPAADRVVAQQRRIAKHQQEWADFCYSDRLVTDGSAPQLVKDIQLAAAFAADDHDGPAMAANVVDWLRGVLHPDDNRRLAAGGITSTTFPWLRPSSPSPLPKCPVTLPLQTTPGSRASTGV